MYRALAILIKAHLSSLHPSSVHPIVGITEATAADREAAVPKGPVEGGGTPNPPISYPSASDPSAVASHQTTSQGRGQREDHTPRGSRGHDGADGGSCWRRPRDT